MNYNVRYLMLNHSEVKMTLHYYYEVNEHKKIVYQCKLLRFEWGNREYKVTETISEWLTPEGNNPKMNYIVKTNLNHHTFQFQYDLMSLKWVLVKIH